MTGQLGEAIVDVAMSGSGSAHSVNGRNGLSGPDKVTTLLLAMGKSLADRIIKKFEAEEIRQLAHCAASLPVVPEDLISSLVSELDDKLMQSQELAGSPDGAQNLITGIVSEDQVADIMSELNGTASDRVWSKLATAGDDKLTQFIANERPQIAAVVISKLDIDKAAAVMEKLSSAQRADLSRRLLALKPVGDSALRLVSERLSDELFKRGDENAAMSKHARLGAILTNLDKSQITEVIGDLERNSPEDARQVKEYVFTFEDIGGMSAPDRARLFDEVPSEQTVVALRDASPELKDLILQSLSPRSKRMVEAELATPVKLTAKNIASVKRSIASLAMKLAEKSAIRLRPEAEANDGA